jgi:hypothetical protein
VGKVRVVATPDVVDGGNREKGYDCRVHDVPHYLSDRPSELEVIPERRYPTVAHRVGAGNPRGVIFRTYGLVKNE